MTPIPTLTTERLTLRAPVLADVEPYAAFYATDRAQFVGGPMTREQVWRGVAAEIGHWSLRGYGRWSVEETQSGLFCGLIGLWFPDGWPEPEIGWDLVGAAEGRGIAYEAAMASRDYAYQRLGWTTAISLVADGNTRSMALARRMGAVEVEPFTHERYGAMRTFRHPGPAERSA